MANIEWDDTSLKRGLDELEKAMQRATRGAIAKIADELLRLSSFEVPHDTGMLQSSGSIEPVSDDEIIVGYNKVYAARLHEHPEYRFQKGRKGKYLEDPLKMNISVFEEFLQSQVGGALS